MNIANTKNPSRAQHQNKYFQFQLLFFNLILSSFTTPIHLRRQTFKRFWLTNYCPEYSSSLSVFQIFFTLCGAPTVYIYTYTLAFRSLIFNFSNSKLCVFFSFLWNIKLQRLGLVNSDTENAIYHQKSDKRHAIRWKNGDWEIRAQKRGEYTQAKIGITSIESACFLCFEWVSVVFATLLLWFHLFACSSIFPTRSIFLSAFVVVVADVVILSIVRFTMI